VIRHFTATAVILDGDRVLLLEHRKLGDVEYDGAQWMPIDKVGELATPPELPDLVATCAEYVTSKVAEAAPS
jgi:hypothetical protein